MRWRELIKRAAACICLLSVIATVIFYTSSLGQWGLSKNDWYGTFNLANDMIALSVVIIMFTNPTQNEKVIIGWMLVPYFILKALYLIASHWDVNIISVGKWHDIWVAVLPICFVLSLLHCLYLRYGQEED